MKTEVFLNHTVSDVTTVGNGVEGEKFGIELELEGRNVALADIAVRGWRRTHDGSLRGESVEYTSAGARTYKDAVRDVNNLFAKFKDNAVEVKDSIRTSTHVHLNFEDQPIKKAINFYALFTLLEEVLQYYSGEDRKGNLFCISSREAEGIVGVIYDALSTSSLQRFAGDRYKYAACNLSTLYKFGTIEVRTMRGAKTAEQVNDWLAILKDMYTYSLHKMETPASLIEKLSYLGAEGLLLEIFQDRNARNLLAAFPAIKTLHYSLMEGARLIQVFAYQFDDAFKAEVLVEKPKKGSMLRNTKLGVPIIYKPDGNVWNCVGQINTGRYWLDGERVNDDHRIQWSEERGRFIVRYPNGDVVQCAWHRAPGKRDEAFVAREQRRPMPPPDRWEPEDDEDERFEPEFDDDMDDEF